MTNYQNNFIEPPETWDCPDNYIEPPETCEWRWLGHLCGMENPERMCSDCPNMTAQEQHRRQQECIDYLNSQIKTLGWTPAQQKQFLFTTYNKFDLSSLTDEELIDFLRHLHSATDD